MKKVRILLLSVLMLIGSVPMLAYDFCVDGIYYYITSEEYRTVDVTSGDYAYTGAVVIPSVVMYDGNNYSVTRIGDSAFYGCTGLRICFEMIKKIY